MTKTIGGGDLKRASTWASSSPLSPGIEMSRNTASTLRSCSTRSASVAESLVRTPLHPRVARKEEGELVEGGPLVVDDEDAEPGDRPSFTGSIMR